MEIIYRINADPKVYNDITDLELNTTEVAEVYYKLGKDKNLKSNKTYQEIYNIGGKNIIFYYKYDKTMDKIIIIKN